jgi:hypothetical protein
LAAGNYAEPNPSNRLTDKPKSIAIGMARRAA